MANEANGSEPLLEDMEELRPIGEIEDADRRRRKDLDRQSARAVKGGATRGKPGTIYALHMCWAIEFCARRATPLGLLCSYAFQGHSQCFFSEYYRNCIQNHVVLEPAVVLLYELSFFWSTHRSTC